MNAMEQIFRGREADTCAREQRQREIRERSKMNNVL
jgi:hypothetical protein